MDRHPAAMWAGRIGNLSVLVLASKDRISAYRIVSGQRSELTGDERLRVLSALALESGAPARLRASLEAEAEPDAPRSVPRLAPLP